MDKAIIALALHYGAENINSLYRTYSKKSLAPGFRDIANRTLFGSAPARSRFCLAQSNHYLSIDQAQIPLSGRHYQENKVSGLLKNLMVLLWLCTCKLALGMSVVFINPGKSDEIYWLTAARSMEAAARQLDIQLEVLYAERNHLNALVFARQLAARAPELKPDYVILSNDYGSGPEVIRILNAAGIKSFMAFSGVGGQREREVIGQARQKFPHWLGSLEPNSVEAGYLTANALVQQARKLGLHAADGKIHVLGLAGDRATHTSIQRNQGLLKALAEHQDVQLDQLVYGEWRRDKAAQQAEWLYARHPSARVVWSGNDLMAFGAIDVCLQRGEKPGREMLFSAINTSIAAFDALKKGELQALAGGHFITGAFALIMLYDYHHAKDFASEGLEQSHSMFILFTKDEADLFRKKFANLNFDEVNFKRFSKVLNPALANYQFSFRSVLQSPGGQNARVRLHRE